MLMPGRMFSSDKYRYSFNTQEKSDEISGIGNHTTTIYWEYDTRLGRRWNLDPIAMSDESEYVVNGNNPLFYIDPLGDFKTKFGAKLYNFLHGGKGEISQANAGNRKGEWFVGKQVDYEGDGEGVAYKRTFGWNNKKITKATDAIGDFAENAEFTAEGKAKISFGAQIGISGTLWGIQGKAEAGYQTFDVAEGKYDIAKLKGYAGLSEKRVHNFFGAEGKFFSDKLRLGGKYDYNYLYYSGYNGPKMVDGTAVHDWTVSFPFKNFGPKIKIIDNVIATQTKASIKYDKTNEKQFYGLDIGAGAKLLLGIDLKFKIGYNY